MVKNGRVTILSAETRTAVAIKAVASSFMPLHVAPHAEGLATAGMWALEGLLAGVGVAVNAQ